MKSVGLTFASKRETSMADSAGPKAPDLTLGIGADSLSSGGTLLGRVGEDDVLLARAGDDSSPSARTARTITARSPKAWSSATRCAVRCITPASASNRRSVARAGAGSDRLLARRTPRRHGVRAGEDPEPPPAPRARRRQPASASIVIVGGGAAGLAAADMLRREGYEGPITMISADDGSAGRPSEPVEGLSGRRGAGRLDSAVAAGAVRRAAHRAAARIARVRRLIPAAERCCSRTARAVTSARC